MRALVGVPGTVFTVNGVTNTMPSTCFAIVGDEEAITGPVQCFHMPDRVLERTTDIARETKQDISSALQKVDLFLGLVNSFSRKK